MAKKTEKKPKTKTKKDPIAYTIEDKYFGKLKVLKSANAWWMDKTKVDNLIRGFKMDCKLKECLVLAGISQRQFEYFKEKHEDFCGVLEALRQLPITQARQTVIVGIQKDPNLAFRYLERKAPDEFKEKKEIDINELPILVEDMFSD